jgi:hypothetical protein
LADHPRDVQWVTWPAPGGFSIPLDLFAKFDGEDEVAPAAQESAPPKRRRRNKEASESTDNNTSEEE